MKSRFLFLLVMLSLLSVGSYAKIWIVNNNVGQSSDFTTLESAVAGATAGDTLYLIGSTTGYSGWGTGPYITIDKKLTLIGPGYFLSSVASTITNSSFIVDALYITSNAGGTTVMGIVFNNYILISANNVLFKRNSGITSAARPIRIGQAPNGGTSAISNVIVTQNYIYNSSSVSAIDVTSGCNNITVSNNYIQQAVAVADPVYSPNATVDIRNNILWGASQMRLGAGILENNIITTSSISTGTSIARNNICDGSPLPSGNNNKLNIDLSTVLVNNLAVYSSGDSWMQLKSGSPALAAGSNGEDCGVFGGSDPYVLSGLPPIPLVYFFSASSSGSNSSGLPVTIKVQGKN